ncbi:hypothetical protein DB31_8232 [Hyalangium minutum]|uniref:Uncharacterized protein n=1 Tax=Hyalangium minutum TaxID=394096 RepID=A0A085WJ86_9BACT|nr:hypothetical protein DB31_8232 [Hyalangium minutum]
MDEHGWGDDQSAAEREEDMLRAVNQEIATTLAAFEKRPTAVKKPA